MTTTYLSPLHRAMRQIALWFEERMPDGLAASEGHLLTYLLSYAPCPVSELVRVFGSKHSTMTSVLDRLEARGLVERKDNPNDRRSFHVALTRKGKTAAEKVNVLVQELEGAIDARVNERAQAGFRKVIEAVGEATQVDVRRRR